MNELTITPFKIKEIDSTVEENENGNLQNKVENVNKQNVDIKNLNESIMKNIDELTKEMKFLRNDIVKNNKLKNN